MRLGHFSENAGVDEKHPLRCLEKNALEKLVIVFKHQLNCHRFNLCDEPSVRDHISHRVWTVSEIKQSRPSYFIWSAQGWIICSLAFAHVAIVAIFIPRAYIAPTYCGVKQFDVENTARLSTLDCTTGAESLPYKMTYRSIERKIN